MKYLFLILVTLSSLVSAKEYKAIFDCSSKDVNYISSRMFLIERTIDMIEHNGDKVKFALTIHGFCSAITSINFDELVEEKDIDTMKKAQLQLQHLIKKKNVKVTVCAMSLNANTIEQEDVLDFVHISPNSFLDTIAYQNDGYALMTFK